MTKKEKQILKESLENFLKESEKMWNEKISHAQIVGFLQGTIRGVISHLSENYLDIKPEYMSHGDGSKLSLEEQEAHRKNQQGIRSL
jgi:predicted RNA-binding protein